MPIELPLAPSYPAARSVAAQLRTDFAFQPSQATLERIIDAAFWASLRREEGVSPTISLAYLPPDQTMRPILFERPILLAAEYLTKLAPAVERPGIHLGVWARDGQLVVWGATRTLPVACFVLEVVAPGLLVVKQRGPEESSKFANVAVLEGDQAKLLSTVTTAPPDSPPVVKTLLGLDETPDVIDALNVQVEIAVSMRKHKRGGSLLVVPSSSSQWRESIVEPIAYGVSPSYSELCELLAGCQNEPRGRRWQDAIHRGVDAIAGLTAVDGATLITDRCQLLAFGAKIRRGDGLPRVEQVATSELVEGATVQIVHPTQLGGTRHLSAAQFAQDQQDAVALVASQDGRFTVFAWAAGLGMVHAYRVETFLV